MGFICRLEPFLLETVVSTRIKKKNTLSPSLAVPRRFVSAREHQNVSYPSANQVCQLSAPFAQLHNTYTHTYRHRVAGEIDIEKRGSLVWGNGATRSAYPRAELLYACKASFAMINDKWYSRGATFMRIWICRRRRRRRRRRSMQIVEPFNRRRTLFVQDLGFEHRTQYTSTSSIR